MFFKLSKPSLESQIYNSLKKHNGKIGCINKLTKEDKHNLMNAHIFYIWEIANNKYVFEMQNFLRLISIDRLFINGEVAQGLDEDFFDEMRKLLFKKYNYQLINGATNENTN